MRRLDEPNFDDTQNYDDITAAKREPTQSRLQDCRGHVLHAYAEYEACAPALETIVPTVISDVARAALHHGFDSATKPMNELRDALTKPIASVRCPFCGISEATTLDHYLPKELHPLYSVYSKNLVPCCAACNSRKATKIIIEDVGVRRFLHPYFDPIPVDSFLDVSINLSPWHFFIDYGVVQPDSMSDAVFTQIESHFRELNLRSRYRSNALLRLTEDRRAFRRQFAKDQSGEILRNALTADAEDLAIEHGPNDWLSVLYRALANSDDFVSGGFEVLFAVQ